MSNVLNLDEVMGAFVVEARELLERMELTLLACEREGVQPDSVNELFRAAHTIKGSAGLFGLDDIVAFTHVMETSLDRVRAGSVELSNTLIDVYVECTDHLGKQVGAVGIVPAHGGDPDEDIAGALCARLEAICGSIAPLPGGRESSARAAETAASQISPTGITDSAHPVLLSNKVASADSWHLSLRFGTEVLRNGMDPLSCIRYLKTFGEIVGVQVTTDAIPTPDQMDPECCYLGFEIRFRSSADKARIESAFEYVRDDCRIRILPPRSQVSEYVALIHAQSGEEMRLGELLVRCGSLTERELQDALDSQSRAPSDSQRPLGEVLIERKVVHAPVIEAALSKQRQQSDRRPPTGDSGSIRIDAGKLDRLIDVVGELTLSGATVDLLARGAGIADLRDAGSRLAHLVEEVRASALQLRMVQIGSTFSRFQRVVRDISSELGKKINLIISGADTELDKTLIEKISDPLLHLVRNALDHGIERPEVRIAQGKCPEGTLKLVASQDAGSIIIEVSDDGAGVDRSKVLAKAQDRGLVPPDHSPSDADILNLILQPGFSTADSVTSLSGRGVGMDVVKRNIEELRGSLEIESQPGLGTTFRIRLPLTLAIIDGFLLRVGGVAYVIPLGLVEECVDMQLESTTDQYLSLRGNALPLLPLYENFGHRGARSRRRGVIVVRWAGKRVGLVVDELLGKLQTVIKPMSPVFESLSGVTGSTILGDGTIAMILDVPALLRSREFCEPSASSLASLSGASEHALQVCVS
jgi:two-component system, chemotaxis family, sensor kinase CheA